MLCQKHGARIILAGDFNSTETLSKSSTGGLLDATRHRAERSACVQQLLDKWRLKVVGSNLKTLAGMGRKTTSPTSPTGTMTGPEESG